MYRGRLERDFEHWVAAGLLDKATSARLLAEYDSRESVFSLGRTLMMIAAVLMASALLLLVAANWEAIPRIARLTGIVFVLWAAYLGAAVAGNRGADRLCGALLVFGVMAFGGAISLVAQMYHLSGDATDAMLLWFAGAVLVALLYRSAAATAIAGFLTFMVVGIDWTASYAGNDRLLLWLMPLMAVVVILLVRYTGADRVRHMAYLLLLGWVAHVYEQFDGVPTALAIAAGGAIAYLAASLKQSPLYPLARTAGAAPAFYAFVLMMMGLFILHVELEGVTSTLMLGIVTLAVAIAVIAISGRDNGAVRYLAYATFAVEVLYLASETLGSIIGTSGFFLVSGLVVAMVAWLVIRLERRFSIRKPAEI